MHLMLYGSPSHTVRSHGLVVLIQIFSCLFCLFPHHTKAPIVTIIPMMIIILIMTVLEERVLNIDTKGAMNAQNLATDLNEI